MLNLRLLVAAGFCGGYRPPPQQGPGAIHAALDHVVCEEDLASLDQRGVQDQLGNRHKIQYQNRVYFYRCLQGIWERRALIGSLTRKIQNREFGGNIIEVAEFGDGDVEVELLYGYYAPSYTTGPAYALCARHLAGRPLPAKMRSISVVGDFDHYDDPGDVYYPKILQWLTASVDAATREPSHACASCIRIECPMKTDFEKLMYGWLKARQDYDSKEALIRAHLTHHGPSKCGMHIAYLSERPKRVFRDALRGHFLNDLMKTMDLRVALQKYYKPDTKAIALAIKNGSLPDSFWTYMAYTSHYDIETGVHV